jgi:hypothetical protein
MDTPYSVPQESMSSSFCQLLPSPGMVLAGQESDPGPRAVIPHKTLQCPGTKEWSLITLRSPNSDQQSNRGNQYQQQFRSSQALATILRRTWGRVARTVCFESPSAFAVWARAFHTVLDCLLERSVFRRDIVLTSSEPYSAFGHLLFSSCDFFQPGLRF